MTIELIVEHCLKHTEMLNQILFNQHFIISKFENMANELANLQAAQAKTISMEELVIKLLTDQKTNIDGLKQQLADAVASNDPAAIQAVSDALNAESDKLNAAIAAVSPAPAPASAETAAGGTIQ